MVAPLLCRLATIVLPVMSVPFTRGQNLNSSVLPDDEVICAVKEMRYNPFSAKTILVRLDGSREMSAASTGASNRIA